MTHRKLYSGTDPARAVSVLDLRAMALRRLPAFVGEFLEGGAEDEITLRANLAAFTNISLTQRVLGGRKAPPDPSAALFGTTCALPLVIAPTGFNGLLWRNGDRALARAAAELNVPFTQSTVSNMRIEDIARCGCKHWMQLYVFEDREAVRAIVERAEAAGCGTLVVTVDATTYGNREWDRRNYASGYRLTLARKLDALAHPRWLSNVVLPGVPGFVNLYDFLPPGQRSLSASADWTRRQIDATLGWDSIAWLRDRWKGKLIVKGIGHSEDACRAVAHGVDGIVLSNHGGRQLDGAPSALATLSDIRERLGCSFPILVDGGVRRGADIVKAVMAGADGVMVGRAVLYGLAAAGEAGVKRTLAILHEEMIRVMALMGIADVAGLRGMRGRNLPLTQESAPSHVAQINW